MTIMKIWKILKIFKKLHLAVCTAEELKLGPPPAHEIASAIDAQVLICEYIARNAEEASAGLESLLRRLWIVQISIRYHPEAW